MPMMERTEGAMSDNNPETSTLVRTLLGEAPEIWRE